MEQKIRRKGIREYKELMTDKPSKFDIWWYGYEVWKYVYGFWLGVFVTIILGGLFA